MSRSVCFRCDWEGTALGRRCPGCGTPLDPSGTGPRAVGRGPGRFLALALAALVGIGVGYRALEAGEGSPAPDLEDRGAESADRSDAAAIASVSLAQPPPFPGLRGRLVFPAYDSTGWPVARQRLYALDLVTGAVNRGPTVPDVQEFLPADGGPGRVVFTSAQAGRGSAYVLRDFRSESRPELLARGDLFAVSPDARTLLVGRSIPDGLRESGCSPSIVEVDEVAIGNGATRSLLVGRLPCGRLVGLGIDGEQVVLSLEDRGEPGIYLLTGRGPRLVLPGHALLSVSPVGGMLVTPAEEGRVRGLGVWPGTPTGIARYWSGRGEPTRFLPRGTELFAQRVVGWSRTGSQAVVTGIVGDRRGMWHVRTTFSDRVTSSRLGPNGVASGRLHPPRAAVPPGELPASLGFSGGAFSVDLGPVFTSTSGSLFLLVREGPAVIPLPPGSPRPAGPVAWLP